MNKCLCHAELIVRLGIGGLSTIEQQSDQRDR